MTLRLHWSPDSANLVVRLALEEFGLSYEPVRVDRSRDAHRAPPYLALNPQGLIPVLEDGAVVLFETGAILWHLAERERRLGPEGPSPADASVRATALKWLFYLSNTVHAELRACFYAERYVDTPEAAGPLRRGLARRLRAHLDLLEGQLGRDWPGRMAAPTVLDLYLGALLRWAQLYPAGAPPLAGIGDWPGLLALCHRIESRPAARRAFAAESIPPGGALSAPRPPELPAAEVTGSARGTSRAG